MLESQPLRSPGVRLGFLMIAGVLLVDVVLLYFCLTLPFSLLSFILGLLLLLSLPVLATLFVGTRAIQRGRYHVDADLLHLDLGQAVEQIPLSAIEDIRYGHELTAKTTFRGLRWPGLYLGQGQTTLDGHERAIHYLATRPPADQLVALDRRGERIDMPARRIARRNHVGMTGKSQMRAAIADAGEQVFHRGGAVPAEAEAMDDEPQAFEP